MSVTKKTFCALCSATSEEIDFSKLNLASFGEECSECNQVLMIYANQQSNESEDTNKELIQLPPKTTLFHLDSNLYSDKRFENPNKYCEKTLLIIGTGSPKRTPVLNNITKLKFKKTVCLVRKRDWASSYFDDIIEAEHEDESKKEETLLAVKNFMFKNSVNFDGVLTYDDLCVVMCAYISTELNLPGIPYEVARSIKNKHEFRRLSTRLGITCPQFLVIKASERQSCIKQINKLLKSGENDEELIQRLQKLRWPIVIKNTFGLGKDFVCKCNDMRDVAKYLQDSLNYQSEIDLAVEEYIDGQEIDIDILIQENKVKFVGISDNFKPDEPYFFEKGGVTPSRELDDDEKSYIAKLVGEWVTQLNIRNSVVHFEARCKPRAIYHKSFDKLEIRDFLVPIEINNRLGGAEVWVMYNAGYGVNLFIEAIDIALGIELDETFLRHKQNNPDSQCICNIYHPARNVRIEKIEVDLESFQRDLSAVELALFRTVGETLTIQDYLGWITVRNKYGSSIEEMKANLEKVMSYVLIHLEDIKKN